MMHRILKRFYEMTIEDWAVALFGASFLVGVWYAFPMVNTITDVWAFGGGVLRAIEAHTLLPGYGVAYGTISFYQNYLVMVPALGFGFVLAGFDIEALKTALVLNPWYSLVVPRITSALTAMVFLIVVYRFLKIHVSSAWWRFALLILSFGNVLTAILVRSGKMWILSTLLGVISFIYLYRAITEEVRAGRPGKLSLISIVAAFLAAANFLFAGIFLVNIPILLYMFPRTYEALKRLSIIVSSGAAAFLAIFALNAANIIEQSSGFVTQFFISSTASIPVERSLTFFESFYVNVRQAIEAFPVLLIALVPAFFAGIRDKTLAHLSLIYTSIYIIAVAVIFRSDHGLTLNVRHIFPICFFLLFLLAAYKTPTRRVAIALSVAGFLIYVYTVVLLSIPTTYNAASAFIENQYGETSMRIDEHVWELTLPMNKTSYGLFATSSCGSTCAHMRLLKDDIAFKPIVVTSDSDPAMVAGLPLADLLVVDHAIPGCTPRARFGNDVPDDGVFDIDINLGRMLLPSFYELRQLGKNIYVYETKNCDQSSGSTL